MSDDKKQLDQLTSQDLSEVKGGLPYEKPNLIPIEAATTTSCTVGTHCDSGHNGGASCNSGLTCSSGTHGASET